MTRSFTSQMEFFFLPFYHPSLAEIDYFKQKKDQKTEKYF